MAYGSPDGDEGIEPYFTHIRGGRPPSAEALAELRERYRAIGGSPLTAITNAQARALSQRVELPVFAGMKHAPPFIAAAAVEARAAGIERLVGLPLAPHYADMSLGAYFTALRLAWDGELVEVHGFHDHPAFVAAVQAILGEALTGFEPEKIFFTAHSLPARIESEGDRYRERLLDSSSPPATPGSHGWVPISWMRSLGQARAARSCARSDSSPTTWRSFMTSTLKRWPSRASMGSSCAGRHPSTPGLNSSMRWLPSSAMRSAGSRSPEARG